MTANSRACSSSVVKQTETQILSLSRLKSLRLTYEVCVKMTWPDYTFRFALPAEIYLQRKTEIELDC